MLSAMAGSAPLLGSLAAMLLFKQVALALPALHWPRQATTVPSFALEYAPMVWLQSTELYMPSDLGAQLVHTRPENNFATVSNAPNPLTLNNLDALNGLGATNVYLTSVDDVTTNPAWLKGVKPSSSGATVGANSCAIIVNDHGSGSVDVFYMYFYAYNQGNTVLGFEIGDHVGDWEHNMIRFQDGLPTQVWYSQHGNGEAFTYDCLEKMGKRPVNYSAKGSHANYAVTGTHDHTIPDVNLPSGPLQDHTDQGTLWDPTLTAYFYSYNNATYTFTPYDPSYPTNWLYYTGKWGDQQYPNSDKRQREIFGISATAKYVGGPTGPEDKQLERSMVCPNNGYPCIIRTALGV